jgi:hypothetical protein
MTALIMDDLSPAPPPWEVYGFVGSDAGADDEWGDYYSSRRNGANGNIWVITGQALSGGDVNAQYVWMGRTREGSTAMSSWGVQGTSPTSASSDYLRFWWDDITRHRPPARSP